MKNIGLLICFLILSTAIYAQKSTLPTRILKTLDKKYPEAKDVNWKIKSKGDYKIKFNLDGKKTIVEIDEDGFWEKTSTHISFEELPLEVQTKVKEQKLGLEITEIKHVITDDNEVYYKVDLTDQFKTIKLRINKKGKITKSEVEML